MEQQTVDEDVISTLKVNNKGWNIQLFANQNALQTLICHECKSVCCDAVELGCDHNDDQIFLFCNVCLTQLINQNNQKCPINGHDEPIIVPNRSSRRHILKSIVYCPYSTAYKSNNNEFINDDDENCQIMDTLGDEKEGDEQRYNPLSSNKCKWKGKLTLNELINKHITQCIRENNPSFTLNFQMKQLKEENEILNEQVFMLQDELEKVFEDYLGYIRPRGYFHLWSTVL